MSVWRVPDLGEGLAEVEILEWRVAVGDTVAAGQPLVTVETEKSVVDVASPQAGRVAALLARPGQRLAVGAPLVEFADGAPRDAGAVVGELPEAAPPRAPSPVAPLRAPGAAIRAAPAVRALAQRLHVDLARVTPTGVDGTVRGEDVERAAREAAGVGGAAVEGLEPLRGVRLAMARNMARAHAQVAPATVMDEADVEAWPEGSDVMARLVRALAAAAGAEPALNAWYDAQAGTRRLHARLDLGIAVQTADGLFVPVLRDAARLDAMAARAEIERLRAAVRNRSLRPEEQRGATLTLSNFGPLGGRFASLVVVPPQVAIVGAGRIDARVVAREGRPVVRRVLPLSLSFDHRVVTGGEAAHFLAAARADLELAR
jgi:pyruvate dehydrogenase E2 component (dihydrolipoamide acetyltransferase)